MRIEGPGQPYDTLAWGNATDPDVIECKTDCYDDQFECTYSCPCYKYCSHGCPCESHPACPDTFTTTQSLGVWNFEKYRP